MKNLIFVNGTMGAGKTATCKELRDILKPAVFLDGDWCWDMRPFTVTEETKCMVMDNICHLLANFLKCSEYKNVIFCWVMDEQSIIYDILARLELTDVNYRLFTLQLSEDALERHLRADVESGLRCADIFERSRKRLPSYEKMNGTKIDVSEISAREAAEKIAREMAVREKEPSFETERLILRPWRQSDAPCLYKYASDPDVGPAAGWNVHTSLENSREIIDNVLSALGTFAVVHKASGEAIGSIGIFKTDAQGAEEGELEVGFWIGKPYWGQGLIPEAVHALLSYCFGKLGCGRIWCGYFEGNEKSHRCQEKCGFLPHHTEDVFWKITGENKKVNFMTITAERFASLDKSEK